MFARGHEPQTAEVGAFECASLHRGDPKGGAGAAGGPQCRATPLAGPLDYGAHSAVTMLRGGSCQKTPCRLHWVGCRKKKEISEQLHKNIKLATGRQDDYNENFVKDALKFYERIMTVPALAQMIVEQEKRDGQNALWNSIGKLVVLASKTADQEERKWAMDSLEAFSD